MGANMVRRVVRKGHQCVVFDMSPKSVEELAKEKAVGSTSLADLVAKLMPPRGGLADGSSGGGGRHHRRPHAASQPGDIVVEGWNSYYVDDMRRAKELASHSAHCVDVGTSGGEWGRERGFCMMIGGEQAVVKHLDPIFAALAPGKGSIPETPGRENMGGTPSRVICIVARTAPATS
jgi:6-phosphogluconate dehydrogenase